MSWWEERIVPVMVDRALSTSIIREERDRACAPLHGSVIEVGFGSGLNIAHYPEAVASVAAVEPSDRGWALSERRRTSARLPIARIGLDGQEIAADDDSYDSAVITYSLCTIPDPGRALREVARVLKPGGELAFLEHGRSPDPAVARWQLRLDPVQRRMAGGCHLSRDIPRLVRDAGFTIDSLEAGYLPGPAIAHPWMYGYSGLATS